MYKDGKWPNFKKLVDVGLGNIDPNLMTAAIREAAAKSIPKAGGTTFKPLWSRKLTRLVRERRRLRRVAEKSESWKIGKLSTQRKLRVEATALRKDKWHRGTEKLSGNAKKTWRLIAGLEGCGTDIDSKVASLDKDSAAILNEFFAAASEQMETCARTEEVEGLLCMAEKVEPVVPDPLF